MAGTGDQRSQYVERGTHLAHQIVGRERRGDFGRMQQSFLAVRTIGLGDLGAESRQQATKQTGIGQARHIGEAHRFGG